MKKKSDKKYRDKLKSKGILSERQHKYYETWINKEENRIKKNKYEKKYNEKINFGGKKEEILDRDNHQCQNCGISQDEHLLKYNCSLNIHHIDGNGYNKDNKNNNLNNLVTLCHSCHAIEHRRWENGKRHRLLKDFIL